MIEGAMLLAAVLLLLNGAAGFLRILIGPGAPDRLLAIQLMATTGIALLLVLAEAMAQPAARDVALALAVLALLGALAFVRRLWWRLPHEDQGQP